MVFFALVVAASFFGYMWFEQSGYYAGFMVWAKQNVALLFVCAVAIKFVGIVWPPLPGGIFVMGTIPMIGWPAALAANFIGTILGNTGAYFLGKKYGWKLLDKIAGVEATNRIRKIKIKPGKELEGVLVYQFVMSSIFVEGISFGAGLLGIKLWQLLVGSAVAGIVLGIPMFYLAGFALQPGNIWVRVVAIAVCLVLVIKLKDRYFE